jgi:hypothetical protein
MLVLRRGRQCDDVNSSEGLPPLTARFFVAANALLAAVSYLLIVGEIKRMVLVK